MIKLFFISILFFSQVHSFCIYNKLTDGSSFEIYQETGHGAGLGKQFKKHMEQGDRRCCSYTEKDCSENQRDHDEVLFKVKVYLVNGKNPPGDVFAWCTTGGALFIRGDAEDYRYECVDAGGFTKLSRLRTNRDDPYD